MERSEPACHHLPFPLTTMGSTSVLPFCSGGSACLPFLPACSAVLEVICVLFAPGCWVPGGCLPLECLPAACLPSYRPAVLPAGVGAVSGVQWAFLPLGACLPACLPHPVPCTWMGTILPVISGFPAVSFLPPAWGDTCSWVPATWNFWVPAFYLQRTTTATWVTTTIHCHSTTWATCWASRFLLPFCMPLPPIPFWSDFWECIPAVPAGLFCLTATYLPMPFLGSSVVRSSLHLFWRFVDLMIPFIRCLDTKIPF